MPTDERIGIHWPPGQRPKRGQKGMAYEITAAFDPDTKKGRIVWPDTEVGHRIEPLDVWSATKPSQGDRDRD